MRQAVYLTHNGVIPKSLRVDSQNSLNLPTDSSTISHPMRDDPSISNVNTVLPEESSGDNNQDDRSVSYNINFNTTLSRRLSKQNPSALETQNTTRDPRRSSTRIERRERGMCDLIQEQMPRYYGAGFSLSTA